MVKLNSNKTQKKLLSYTIELNRTLIIFIILHILFLYLFNSYIPILKFSNSKALPGPLVTLYSYENKTFYNQKRSVNRKTNSSI
jgi:hypothetical protein